MNTIKKSILVTSVAALVGILASSRGASAADAEITAGTTEAAPQAANGSHHATARTNHGYDANVCKPGVHIRAAPCPTCSVIDEISYPGTVHVYDTAQQPAGWAYGYTHVNGVLIHGYFPVSTWQC